MSDLSTSARPYARAAFAFASEKDSLSAWQQFLNVFAAMIENDAFAQFYKNPAATGEQVKNVVLSVAKEQLRDVQEDTWTYFDNFVSLLLQYARLPLVPSVANQFHALVNEMHATAALRVTSAKALSDATKDKLAASLAKKLGESCELTYEINEELIGGVEVQSDTWVMNASVSRRLEKLVDYLT